MLHMMTSSKNVDISKKFFCIFAATIREGTYPENFTHIALLVLDSPTPSPMNEEPQKMPCQIGLTTNQYSVKDCFL